MDPPGPDGGKPTLKPVISPHQRLPGVRVCLVCLRSGRAEQRQTNSPFGRITLRAHTHSVRLDLFQLSGKDAGEGLDRRC